MRLIDANVLLEKLKQNLRDYHDVMNEEGVCATLIAIKYVENAPTNAPTIDAEPVVHGHWKQKGFDCICSNCGGLNGAFTVKYCPDCGAKMDGKYEMGADE